MRRLIGVLVVPAIFGYLALALYTLWQMIFAGFPIGWALMIAVQCGAFAKQTFRAVAEGWMMRQNSEVAATLSFFGVLGLMTRFVLSEWPRAHSAWWALAMPIVPVIVALLVLALTEFLLDRASPSGRRATHTSESQKSPA